MLCKKVKLIPTPKIEQPTILQVGPHERNTEMVRPTVGV